MCVMSSAYSARFFVHFFTGLVKCVISPYLRHDSNVCAFFIHKVTPTPQKWKVNYKAKHSFPYCLEGAACCNIDIEKLDIPQEVRDILGVDGPLKCLLYFWYNSVCLSVCLPLSHTHTSFSLSHTYTPSLLLFLFLFLFNIRFYRCFDLRFDI